MEKTEAGRVYMKLIGRTVSPFTRRVAVAMALRDMPREYAPVSLAEQDRLRRYSLPACARTAP